MQLGDREPSDPTGLVSSGLSSEGQSQTAEHDTGSLMPQASRLTGQPSVSLLSERRPCAGARHVVVVKAQGAVINSVDPGTIPEHAFSNPKPPPDSLKHPRHALLAPTRCSLEIATPP